MKVFANEPAPHPVFEDLRSVIRQLQQTTETHSIALHRTLHDELGALLVSTAMDLASAVHYFERLGTVDFRLRRAQKSVMSAVDLKRRLSEELRPSLLDNLGLFAAMRWHIKHGCAHSSAVCTERYPDEEMSLNPDATTALFRICQESMDLVLREPDLKSVHLEVKVENAAFHLTLAHEHEGNEPVDLFVDKPDFMYALSERTRTLAGDMQVGRSACGTALIARFPLARIM